MRRFRQDWNQIYDGARWRAPRHKDYYEFSISHYPNVHDLLITVYHVGKDGSSRSVLGGFSSLVAVKFKELVRAENLRPVKRSPEERRGKCLTLWWYS